MKTTGTFLLFATFVAFFYPATAIIDPTGTWYATDVRGLQPDSLKPRCWIINITKIQEHFEGTSTFLDSTNATVTEKFQLARYNYEDYDLFNIADRSGDELRFWPFNVQAFENKQMAKLILQEMTDNNKNEKPVFFKQLNLSSDKKQTESSPLWTSCVVPQLS